MKIVIDIPKEFESHFEFDRFADSLARVASDIEALGFMLSGRYERETITMIRKAFENATPLPKGHGALKDEKDLITKIELNYRNSPKPIYVEAVKDMIRTTVSVIKADS